MKNRNKFYLIALCTLALCLALAGTTSAESVTATFTEEAIAVVYEWVSSNEQVATVDEWGNVMPVAPGTVVISAYLQGELVAQHEMSVLAECTYCGGSLLDGATKHTTKWSKFDPDNHYQCLEEQIHHCDFCDRDFPCNLWNNHARCIACGKSWCVKDSGDHRTPPCGKTAHRPCMTSNDNADRHKKLRPCGHYACQDGDHWASACGKPGHYLCTTGQHEKRSCGQHHSCDDGNHEKCSYGCGKFCCNGQSHGTGNGECSYVPPNCRGCGVSGVQHTMQTCGTHCVEEEGDGDFHARDCPEGDGFLCQNHNHNLP